MSWGLVHLWVARLGLRLKKSRSTPSNETPKPTAPAAPNSTSASSRSIRKSSSSLTKAGTSTTMTRRFARCLGGARIHEGTPEGNWQIVTILGAMSLDGMIATMTVTAATDTDIFLAYLDHFLCPALTPGDVVVMDNLSAHKVDGVRQRI